MNSRLRQRLEMGIRGGLPLTDSHKAIHQDTLTYILRLEERVGILEKFREFMRGFLNSTGADIPEVHTKSLLKRLSSVDNDIKRLQPKEKVGC